MRPRLLILLVPALLCLAGCASTAGYEEEGEPVITAPETEEAPAAPSPPTDQDQPATGADEGEVPLAIAQSEAAASASTDQLAEVVIEGRAPTRDELIRSHVAEARALLRDVKLDYVFTGKGSREVLRGRPVAFALWSEKHQQWTVAHLEIPRPPLRWKPGGRPLRFLVLTPGIQAQHVRGTGAERLMFAFTRDGEKLQVYGRKFPAFDSTLLKKKQWRAVAETAQPIVYLPFTEDTYDPVFVSGGRQFLLDTARKATEDLRAAKAPSSAFPGTLLADAVPPEVIATLAVIEQTDDEDFVHDPQQAVGEVLSHYGLKREEAFRYSVSRAAALGPMQFTNRRGNGTYAHVVRSCPDARLDPDFERGATNLLNSMKAAICLFDLDLADMREDIRDAYVDNRQVLGIFPVADYNGGQKNVAKLYRLIKRMKLGLEDLRRPAPLAAAAPRVTCPCLWKAAADGAVPVALPKYNNENRWYIQKYQNILGVFE
ncbi:MAG TPA: hypothetical protein VMI92_08800 [Steroidobacteraceae bacterium]|nr:hypothetical protein [Steroidobacteraceae bacterium]